MENFGFSQSDMESIQGGLDSSGATGGVPPSQQDQDNYAQATANIIAEPKVGVNRSNVVGMANYDPQFAAALKISRGLNPGVNTGGLDVPSYLQPQLPGNKVLNEAGDRTMYYSPVERFMQEDLADIAQSGPGLIGLVGKGLDALFGGIDFLSNSKAGNKIEDVFEEQKRIEIADLEKERLAQGLNKDFEPLTFPTIDRTNVLNNSFMDSGASLATDPNLSSEDIALRRQFSQDIANASNAGITALPEAKPFSESINNQEIAAGNKKGSTLSDREQEDTANYADYLKRVGKAKNEYGLYEDAMSQLFANRQKDLPKEVQSKQQANLYPKDIVYLNQLAEDESVAREVYNNLLGLGPKRDFTSPNVNIIPDIFNKDGYTLENKYFSDIFTPKQVKEMQNKGYSLQGIENLRTPKQFPTKKTVPFSSLSDKLKEQYFLNTNLDYGAPIKTPYNVVY